MRLSDAAARAGDPISHAALVEQVRVALRVMPAFRVLGVTHPALTPSSLIDVVEQEGRVRRVTLGHGEIDGSAGRFVAIISGAGPDELPEPAELLASEISRHGESVRQPAPSAPDLTPTHGLRLDQPMAMAGRLSVDGIPAPVELVRQGRLWAGRLSIGDQTWVAVLARGIEPASLELGEVFDLRPYLSSWESRQLRTHTGAADSGVIDLTGHGPGTRLSAHLTLLRAALAGPREPHPELWDAAVAAQVEHSGQDPAQADAAIAAMVNQAVLLAERRSWLTDSFRREVALEEIARYTVFESDVRSRRAQEWWHRLWVLITSERSGDPAGARQRQREFTATEEVWLTSWDRWSQGGEE